MPADWKTYRADVRATSNTKEAEIDALADLDSVKAYQNYIIVEVRYLSTYVDEVETIGPETASHSREVDQANITIAEASRPLQRLGQSRSSCLRLEHR